MKMMNSLLKSCSILVIAVLINLNYCQNNSNLVINGDFEIAIGNDSSTTINNQEVKIFQNTSILGWERKNSSYIIAQGNIFNPVLNSGLVLYLNEGSAVTQQVINLIPNAFYNFSCIWETPNLQNNQNLIFQTFWNNNRIASTEGSVIPPIQKSNLIKVQANAQGQGLIEFRVVGNNVVRGVAIDNVEVKFVQNAPTPPPPQPPQPPQPQQPEKPIIQNAIEVLKKCNGFKVKCGSILIWVAWYALCPYANFWGLGTYCPNIKIERF